MHLVSFSDSHGFWPWRLGREATEFSIKPNYKDLVRALQTGEGLSRTIEVDPNFGKYHYSGHRKCNVCLDPSSSKKAGQQCSVCGKKLTIGVAERVEELADRDEKEALMLALRR